MIEGMLPDKTRVLAALTADVTSRLDAVEQIAAAARDEVSSDETKQEGKYDTRATEASYLARGQAWRVAELRRLASWCALFDAERPLLPPVVQVGALARVEGGRSEVLFMAPIGGAHFVVEGTHVRVISPTSPLGGALVGLEAEDCFEVVTPRGTVDYELIALC